MAHQGCMECIRLRHRTKHAVGHVPGVKDPADGIVDELGLGERLVTAFVGNNPETGHDETVGERIERPEGETSEGIEVRMGKVELLRCDERVEVLGTLADASDEEKVPDTDTDVSVKNDASEVQNGRTRRGMT